ncbi:MAG: MFS transporter [Myxococcota bacterium]
MALNQNILARLARRANVPAEDTLPVAWAFAQFFLLLCGLYVVRPLRDEMGIASGVENMQWLFSGTFVAMLAVVPLYGWAVSRWSRRTVVPRVHGCLAVTMVLAFVATEALPPTMQGPIAAAIFIWISVFNVLVVSVFWSLLADVFSPEAGRRTFGVIAAAGTAGALLGPTLAATLVRWVPPTSLLLIAALLLAAASAAAYKLDRAADRAVPRDAEPMGGSLWAGFVTMFKTPRLRGISVYLLCMTWISTTLYFAQAHVIDQNVTDSAERTALFAEMDLAVNLLALTVQLTLTGRLMLRWGLAVILVALPMVSGAALAAVALFPSLGVVVVAQVVRRAVNFSLARPAREVLYTDVSLEAKYKGKNVVDTLVYRGGDAVAGWAYSGLGALGVGLSATAGLGVAIAAGWAWLAHRLGADATPSPPS